MSRLAAEPRAGRRRSLAVRGRLALRGFSGPGPGPYLWGPLCRCRVKAFFSYFLIALVLLQTFSREVLVVDFALNRAALAARFCVNKARPQLHCDGKCYFAKRLKQQEERESKAPNALREKLEMLPLAWGPLAPPAPVCWAGAPLSYGPGRPAWAPAGAGRGVFHPPQAPRA